MGRRKFLARTRRLRAVVASRKKNSSNLLFASLVARFYYSRDFWRRRKAQAKVSGLTLDP